MATNERYTNFSADGFIKDEYFQRWVYRPDSASEAFWQRFLRENPGQRDPVSDARDFLSMLEFNDGDVFETRIHALKERIDRAIDEEKPLLNASNPINRISAEANRFVWVGRAASIALFVSAIWGVMHFFQAPDTKTHKVVEQVTARGQRTVITLQDGTRVWLNVDTRLTYAESFEDQPVREVTLDGEAYFQVPTDSARPFIVNTDGVRVRVLGTTFLVKSYKSESRIETTLVEGSVVVESLSEESDAVTLKPAQAASYDKSTRRIRLDEKAELESATGWKDGRLVFDEQPLSEILAELERWYDVHISVEDSNSLKCHFSAKIGDLSLIEVLDLFKASDGIEYTVKGREVSIKGRICNP